MTAILAKVGVKEIDSNLAAAIRTVVVLVFAWRFRRAVFWAYLPMAIGLFISTMYLRMHYAVDVVAGFATAAAGVLLGPRLEKVWYSGVSSETATSSAWR